MAYEYEFDDTLIGELSLRRADYEAVQQGLRMLQLALSQWNDQALAHGAASKPYEREVSDLARMIKWGKKQLDDQSAIEIVVNQISVGSVRYIKAALMFMHQRRQAERDQKASQGWPSAALKSLDDANNVIGRISQLFQYEPNPVLWEVAPDMKAATTPAINRMAAWDVFISHASEDKADFVEHLAAGLRSRGLRVWYDDFALRVGDSLRRSIDNGLAKSRFGVVVISPAFLGKEWPQKELDGLASREVDGTKVILPVWHNITAAEVRECSPTLADRLATSSSNGLNSVIEDLVQAIDAGGSLVAGDGGTKAPAPGRVADVRVTLRDLGRHGQRFVIENRGPGEAYDVNFDLDLGEGGSDPIARGEREKKLPIEVLQPDSHVELIAGLSHLSGTTFTADWEWRDEDNQMHQKRRKVSLQHF